MKKSKIFLSLTLVLTALLLLLGMTSCSEPPHEHSYGAWDTVTAPTCTAFGLQKRACECGHVEYGTMAVASHTPVTDAAVAATCTNAGKTEGSHCEKCGTVIVKQDDVPVVAHSYSEWATVTAPTCTAFGIQRRACECGAVEYGNIAAVDHTPVTDAAVAATCTNAGKTEGSHCEKCGTVIVKQNDVPVLAHSYSGWESVTAPTCTSIGLNKKVCKCGATEYAVTDALGHTAKTDAAVAAACTTAGKTEGSHCEKCGVILVAQLTVAPTGHSYGDATVITEATCQLDGAKRYTCQNTGCGYSYDESFALAKVNGEQIVADAAGYVGKAIGFNVFGEFLEESAALVISSDGKIVVPLKTITGASSVEIMLNGEYYEVTDVLAWSSSHYLAVVKIDATDLACAPLCTAKPTTGDTVYTVGAPVLSPLSISGGIVSNADCIFYGVSFIQHDADLFSGYDGGPLFNEYGEVIGINIGYIHDQYDAKINFSAYVSDIDTLDYSTPMSIADWGKSTFTSFDHIRRWVNASANFVHDDAVAYRLTGSDFYYAIGYFSVNNVCFVEGEWYFDNYTVGVRIYLDNTEGTYQYYAAFSDGVFVNETFGFIDAATYTQDTVLTYDSYYGKYWTESEIMALYSKHAYKVVGWLDFCLQNYFFDLSIADTFGFTAIEQDDVGEKDALGSIKSYILANATYDPFYESYRLFGQKADGDNLIEVQLAYRPATDETPESVTLTIFYIVATGEQWSLQLCLDPMEEGYMFLGGYATYYDQNFEFVNSCWGYIDPTTFTDVTPLVCYYFSGLNDYEDLLTNVDYSRLLLYMLECFETTLEFVDPTLSLKDFGFYFLRG